MFSLVKQLKHVMKDYNRPWYVCGGYGIDLYLGTLTRDHKDIDISVSFNDSISVIKYLSDLGYRILAPIGEGRLVDVEYALEHQLYFDNIWCMKGPYPYIKEIKVDGVYKYLEMEDRIQESLDFIEVLFNDIDNEFKYLKNPLITRSLEQLNIEREDVLVLAPEILLLFKSRSARNKAYRADFDHCMKVMKSASKTWLLESIEIENPDGHPWIKGE
jgi:hypothetical protein